MTMIIWLNCFQNGDLKWGGGILIASLTWSDLLSGSPGVL